MHRVIVGAALLPLLLVACSHGTPEDPAIAAQRAYFAELADTAEAQQASDVQVEALRQAAETGDLTVAMVTALYQPYFDCVAGLGGTGEVFGNVEIAPGIVAPGYRVGFPSDLDASGGEALDAAVMACEQQHIGFVWQALYMQPIAVEARSQPLLAAADSIRSCVDAAGIQVGDQPSSDELARAVLDARAAGVDCYSGPMP